MKEKDEKQKHDHEEETSELNIEELMDVQGGIEDDDEREKGSCGLGCFVGTGSVGE